MKSLYLTEKQRTQRCKNCGALINKDGKIRRDMGTGCEECKRGGVSVQSSSIKGTTEGWQDRHGGR